MSEPNPDMVSKVASLGGLLFVGMRIAWHVVNSEWVPLLTFVGLIATVSLIYLRLVSVPDVEEDDLAPDAAPREDSQDRDSN